MKVKEVKALLKKAKDVYVSCSLYPNGDDAYIKVSKVAFLKFIGHECEEDDINDAGFLHGDLYFN